MIRAFIAVVVSFLVCALTRAEPPTTRPVAEIARPTLITLDVKDATIKSVLDSLQQRSKFVPTLAGGQPELLETKISISMENVPWIEALMRVCETAGLSPNNYGDRWTISPRGGQRMFGPRHVEGAAMIALTTAVVASNITYDQPDRTTHQLQLSGVLAVEPSLEVDGITSIIDATVVDNLGRSFPVSLRSASSAASFAVPRRDFSLTADLPDAAADRIAEISGTVIAPALIERQKMTIPDLLAAEGQQYAAGKGHVTVGPINRRNASIFEVELRFDAGALPENAFARLRANSTRIQPEQTNKSEPATLRVQRVSSRDGMTVLTLYVQFQRAVPKPQPAGDDADNAAADEPHRVLDLQWDLPVRYVDVSIPFKIQDISLP